MSQWGRPRHPGVRHNQRVRGRGTWSEQDQRLGRHKKAKLRAQRGKGTWSEEHQRLSMRKKAKIRRRAGRGLWGEQARREDRERRRRGRGQRHSAARRWRYPAVAAVGALILLVAFRVPVVAVLMFAALVLMTRQARRRR